ncbi:UNVERIFIED_CONTAM: Retrovirus-related Pol polyprotein from transposon TNT 1-94 [Sesamum radiatum]|uniref:Retrovirus-related Pol polyprotein from transposon TNT 1-94 n=1 Tax=Sesamum radiatum TaxID=300843 RepID=A0AAW2U8Z9_SESRA
MNFKEELNPVGHGSVHDEFYEIAPVLLGHALETAAKLLNIAPSKTVPQPPYEIWHGKPASNKYLRVWGSPTYIKRLVGGKLDSRCSLCSRRDEVLIEESSEELQHDSTTSLSLRFTLMTHPKASGPYGVNGSTNISLELTGRSRPSRPGSWRKDILSDLGSTLRKPFSCGHGQDHSDTACHSSMNDYEIWQMEVKTAFLNSFVEEEIYMDQPEGSTTVGEERKVYRLQRSIYGLKQAFRSWNTRFDEVIQGYDFIKNDYDPCICKKISGSSIAYLVLYVDDILLIGNDVKMLGDIKAWLST